MSRKKAIRGICVLTVALAIILFLPQRIGVDQTPWEVAVARSYADGGFVLIKEGNTETRIYKIGPNSQRTSTVLGFISRHTSGFIAPRYMLIRCGGFKEVRFLSPEKENQSQILMRSRFVKPGSANFAKVEELYNAGCKEMLPAKQHEVMESLKKIWSSL